MFRKWIMTLAFCIGFMPVLNAAESPTTQKLMRDAMLAQRKAVVAANMHLTENEEKGFWPIYDTYQIELNKLNAEIEAIVMKFAVNQKDITEPLAKELMTRAMKVERDRLDLKKATCSSLQENLGSKLAARFYQIENKINALVSAETTMQIPLVK